MENRPCPEDKTDCPLRNSQQGCFEDKHHLYYPRNNYRKPVEKEFRNLGCNVVKLCRHYHDTIQEEPPPEKPSRDEMLAAIALERKKERWY